MINPLWIIHLNNYLNNLVFSLVDDAFHLGSPNPNLYFLSSRRDFYFRRDLQKRKNQKRISWLADVKIKIWFLRSRRAFWDLAGLRGDGDLEDFCAVGFGFDSDLRLTLAFFGSLSESDTIGSPLIAHSICFMAFINPFRFFLPGRWSFDPS